MSVAGPMACAYGDWEPVIGLEVHAQLLTRTKIFCRCQAGAGGPPNSHTCPVCLGLPGALPQLLNEQALRLAIAAALALGCTVNQRSVFARKSYFYPDLPKGYQISQHEEPLAVRGQLAVEGRRRVGITRLHLEEDAGKSRHSAAGGGSLLDLNRAGTPLIEIVSEPALRSPAEARVLLRRLREVLMFIGACDGNLEQGSFRCDANVSVRPRGQQPLSERVEVKNINSFRFVEEALDCEIRRQIRRRERGEAVRPQTRGYSPERRRTYLLRDKEGDEDYRYFPEPDLPPLCLDPALIAEVSATLPELPARKRARFVELGLTRSAAFVLTSHPRIAALFEAAVGAGADPIKVSNFLQSEVLRDTRIDGLQAAFPVSAEQLAELTILCARGKISGKQAKQVYTELCGSERRPAEVIARLGLELMADEAALDRLAAQIVAAHPAEAQRYRRGKTKLLGFFVGQLMKATGGSAEPKLANKLLRARLEADQAKSC